MKKKSTPKTAAELLSELRANPKWVAQRREADRLLEERRAEYRAAELPLVADLGEAGMAVSSVWDLVNTTERYPAAIPVLLRHITKGYPDRVREGIARALAVPEARVGWETLMSAFRRESDLTTSGVKWALAMALGAAGTDEELNDVIPLLQDVNLGRNRVPLLQILARSRNPRSIEILESLEDDESLAQDVKDVLKQARSKRAPKRRH